VINVFIPVNFVKEKIIINARLVKKDIYINLINKNAFNNVIGDTMKYLILLEFVFLVFLIVINVLINTLCTINNVLKAVLKEL